MFLIILLCISTSISVAAGPRRLPEGASPGDGPRFTRPDGVERGDRSSRRSDRTRPDVDEPGGSGGGGYSSLVQPEIDPASGQANTVLMRLRR